MFFFVRSIFFVIFIVCYMYRDIFILKFCIKIIVFVWNVYDLCICLFVKICILILKFIVVWMGGSVLLNICIIVYVWNVSLCVCILKFIVICMWGNVMLKVCIIMFIWNVRDLCICLFVNSCILILEFIVICMWGSVLLIVCIIVFIWNFRNLCVCLFVNSCIMILRIKVNIYNFCCFCMMVGWIDFWFVCLCIIYRRC